MLSAPVRAAMELVARSEGIVLDPVYTGRAAAGLVAEVRRARSCRVVVPSCCTAAGSPGLFGHSGLAELPGWP